MGGITSNHIKRLLHKAHAIKTWQLLLVFVLALFLAATFLRFDHLKMNQLRENVIAADRAEDDTAIKESLSALRSFTFSHIIISATEDNGVQSIVLGSGPIYLEHQYLRAANAALTAAAKTNGNHNNIYASAAATCKPRAIANGWAWNSPGYLECMTSELAARQGNKAGPSAVTLPSTELYRYNYASPIWAPTIAGFTLVLCAILSVVIFIRFLIWCTLKVALIFLKKR